MACVSQSDQKKRLSRLSDLVDAGLVSGDEKSLQEVARHYDIGVTPEVLQQVQNHNDPVAKQYVPSTAELSILPDEESDPIGDLTYTPIDGIVHRYPDRVLFKVSSVCAVYCRYCFRREMIGAGADHLSDKDIDAALEYIKAHNEIWEVILTGGDPLILSPRRLAKIIEALDEIDHVQIIRIHTRIPIANPSKIDDTLLGVLKTKSSALQLVVHINHAQEISSDVRRVIYDMRMNGVSFFSQSVLLHQVNDCPSVLETLFKTLNKIHVKPYYLHHMDHAKGTSHFRVSIARGKNIMRQLQGRVSGTCLPKYMLDIPGGHGKIPINDESVRLLEGDVYTVTDYQGGTHIYVDAVPDNTKVGV